MKHQLCQDIEQALNRNFTTPAAFDELSQTIFERCHTMVSATTLKRLWGYNREPVTPRRVTLDILSSFLGYRDWEDYQAKHRSRAAGHEADIESNPILSRHINVERDMKPGERLRLLWQPERVCDVVYLGELTFRVEASQNTRLQPGTIFKCQTVTDGEPLYIMLQPSAENSETGSVKHPTPYVCGKISGIRYQNI